MEMRKNKSLIFLGVALMIVAPIVIFSFDLIIGALLFIVGLVSVLSSKNKSPIMLILLSIISIALLVGYILLHGLLSFGFEMYVLFEYEEQAITTELYYYVSEMLLYDYLEMFEDFESIAGYYLIVQNTMLPLAKALTLLVLLTFVNAVTKKRFVRVVAAVLFGVFSIILIKQGFENLIMHSILKMAIEMEEPGFLCALIDGYDFEDIIGIIIHNCYSNNMIFAAILSVVVPIITTILGCFSAAKSCCKKQHEEKIEA